MHELLRQSPHTFFKYIVGTYWKSLAIEEPTSIYKVVGIYELEEFCAEYSILKVKNALDKKPSQLITAQGLTDNYREIREEDIELTLLAEL